MKPGAVWPYPAILLGCWLLLFPPEVEDPIASSGHLVEAGLAGDVPEPVFPTPTELATAPDSLILRTGVSLPQLRFLRSHLDPSLLTSDTLAFSSPDRTVLGDSLVVVLDGLWDSAQVTLGEDSLQHRRDGSRKLFTYLPPDTGLYVFELEVSGAVVGAFGVQVDSRRPTSVLILESAPSFETTHLRTWLTGTGNSVGRRTRISTDRFRTESFGLGDLRLDRLSRESLRQFDLVLVDDREVAELTGVERQLLRDLQLEGLGLVVLVSGTIEPVSGSEGGWQVESQLDASTRGRVGDGEVALAPATLMTTGNWTAFEEDPFGRALVTARRVGRGRQLLTRVSESFPLLLRGDSAVYSTFWTRLLNRAARPDSMEVWRAAGSPFVVGSALSVFLRSGRGMPLATVRDPEGRSERLSLRQEHSDPSMWSAVLWPTVSGWYQVESEQDRFRFYVDKAGAWGPVVSARDANTARLASAFGLRGSLQDAALRRPMHPGIPVVLITFSLAWLWFRKDASTDTCAV